ncbi:ras guanine nucleotide exchange factor R-like [Oppia nitens]|uniref:ras guanine nucleotide exchange factor R-like n=1 Tax=Oppia nitens TaxID=1686743 RepID=UPI0023D9D06B|nr:ras guanine nucleotide exchange factor R-like [Oppia nitens]
MSFCAIFETKNKSTVNSDETASCGCCGCLSCFGSKSSPKYVSAAAADTDADEDKYEKEKKTYNKKQTKSEQIVRQQQQRQQQQQYQQKEEEEEVVEEEKINSEDNSKYRGHQYIQQQVYYQTVQQKQEIIVEEELSVDNKSQHEMHEIQEISVKRESPSPQSSSRSPAIINETASVSESIGSNSTVADMMTGCSSRSGSSRKVGWRSKTWKGQKDTSNEDNEMKSPVNYPRKHSLTVPGEPRHFRQLHRRESGSRSPIDSSYSGRSPSEMSTPSPSCSNSINEDHSASSYGSGTGLAIELARKCTLSADSLLLHTGINSDESGASGVSAEETNDSQCKSSLKPSFCNTIGQRRISTSISSDRIHQQSKSEQLKNRRSVSPKKFTSRKPQTTTPDTTEPTSAAEPVGSGSGSSSTSRRRKGSMAFVSTGKIAKLLRRTHSAGCSKDVPSYALFLSEKPTRSGDGKEHQKRGRKQAPALEDMKQRLRFLRRRHTDSSIESSVRPSKDELDKWANSFIDLMSSRYGSALFRAFLSREFSEENIEFWMACEEFKKCRQSKLSQKSRKIFDDFLAVKAPKEVNLDPKLRTVIMQTLATPARNMFDLAQRKIQGLLESDAYLRFLQSELYKDLIISHETTTTTTTSPTTTTTTNTTTTTTTTVTNETIAKSPQRPIVAECDDS